MVCWVLLVLFFLVWVFDVLSMVVCWLWLFSEVSIGCWVVFCSGSMYLLFSLWFLVLVVVVLIVFLFRLVSLVLLLMIMVLVVVVVISWVWNCVVSVVFFMLSLCREVLLVLLSCVLVWMNFW